MAQGLRTPDVEDHGNQLRAAFPLHICHYAGRHQGSCQTIHLMFYLFKFKVPQFKALFPPLLPNFSHHKQHLVPYYHWNHSPLIHWTPTSHFWITSSFPSGKSLTFLTPITPVFWPHWNFLSPYVPPLHLSVFPGSLSSLFGPNCKTNHQTSLLLAHLTLLSLCPSTTSTLLISNLK